MFLRPPSASRRPALAYHSKVSLMASTSMPGVPGDLIASKATAGEDAHTIMINRVSWGAIFAGVVVGLVVQVLLTMLGLGIGVATLTRRTATPRRSRSLPASGMCFPGSSPPMPGGYIAARMSGKTVATTGALHGLTTWAFTTLLVLYLLRRAVGSIVGGAFSGVVERHRRGGPDSCTGRRPDAAGRQPARRHRRTRSARPGTIRKR